MALMSAAFQEQFSHDIMGYRKGRMKRSKRAKPISRRVGGQEQRKSKKSGELQLEDEHRPPRTLAQRLGLVDGPPAPLTHDEWTDAHTASRERNDSANPCPICHEPFKVDDQVLLSCSHVFHRACLRSFERFSGKRCCPLCRHDEYEKRRISDGNVVYRERCAILIQSQWRGYVARKKFHVLQDTVPPKNPQRREDFYMRKLEKITDTTVSAIDASANSIDALFAQIDQNLRISREAFSVVSKNAPGVNWEVVKKKVSVREQDDCAICMAAIDCSSLTQKRRRHENEESENVDLNSLPVTSAFEQQPACDQDRNRNSRAVVLLSCSHMFHAECINSFEKFSRADAPRGRVCPLCRSEYEKLPL